jgi:integrase
MPLHIAAKSLHMPHICPEIAAQDMSELTVKYIEALEKRVKAGDAVREWHPDKDGLLLRVRKTGGMSFVLRRWGFKSLTLGPHTIGLATARKLAREAIVQQTQGVDPAEKKQEARAAKNIKPVDEISVEETIDRWIDRYAKAQLRTWPAIQRSLRSDVTPRWGKRPLKSITRPMIAQLIDDIVDRDAPRQAALVFAYLHRMFGWCVSRGYLDSNPAEGLQKPKQAPSRERVLSDPELKLILLAAQSFGYPFQPIVELLAFSGQRKSEIGAGRWSEIDFNNNVWNLPASRTKNKNAHSFPITPTMKSILEKLPRKQFKDSKEQSVFLFTTTGETPVSGYSRVKIAVDKRIAELNDGMSIPAWTFHDLRRTAATGMASLRIPVEVIEQVLNHKSGKIAGVAGIYNRHGYEDEMRDALEKWDAKIQSLIAS